jgi:hypothetical protein
MKTLLIKFQWNYLMFCLWLRGKIYFRALDKHCKYLLARRYNSLNSNKLL